MEAPVDKKLVGKVVHYYTKLSVAVIELSDELNAGDRISIEGTTTNLQQGVDSMQIEHENVKKAGKGQAIGIKTQQRVREEDLVFKVMGVPVDRKLVGKITHYFTKISVAVVELSSELKAGDRILIEGMATDFQQGVESMQIEHEKIEKAGKGQSVGLKMEQRVREGDLVFKVG
jgi:putative protease